MRLDRRHWIVALVLAVGLHLGLAVAIFSQKADADAKSAGIGGIEIALGPVGGAPGTVAAAVPEFEAEEIEPYEPPAETATPTPVEPAETEIVEAPETTVEAVAAATVLEAPPVSEMPDAVEATQVVKEAPAVEDAPVQEAIAVPKPIAAPPPPKRKPTPPEPERADSEPNKQANEAVKTEPTTAEVAAVAPSAPGAAGKSGTQDDPNAGDAARDTSAGGMPGSQANYAAILKAWLERHKEYPRRARQRRHEGVVMLYLVIDRTGHVLEYGVRESSGHTLLDKATIDMLKRAQPLPAMPDDMRRDRLELIVPVQFFIS